MRRALLVVVLSALTAVVVAAPVAAQPRPQPQHYVALGDSFASGALIPNQQTDPLGCLRSDSNYASLVAEVLDPAEFTDVTCGGAEMEHLSQPQTTPLGVNPAQFDALRPDTDLVTITISGNDLGFFEILLTCGLASVTAPDGAPCQEQVGDRYHQRVDALGPGVAAALAGIRQRSPDATVVLVNYLRILPPEVGCWPLLPIAAGDVPYLDGLQQQLGAMLAEQAAAAGVVFVDSYAASLGHDVCQPPSEKWVEGLIPTSAAFPVHPNAAGMRAVSDLVVGALTEPVRADLA